MSILDMLVAHHLLYFAFLHSRDVLNYINSKGLKKASHKEKTAPPSPLQKAEQEPLIGTLVVPSVDIPLTNMRNVIAKRLTQSKVSLFLSLSFFFGKNVCFFVFLSGWIFMMTLQGNPMLPREVMVQIVLELIYSVNSFNCDFNMKFGF